jgi:hypothetical protein
MQNSMNKAKTMRNIAAMANAAKRAYIVKALDPAFDKGGPPSAALPGKHFRELAL